MQYAAAKSVAHQEWLLHAAFYILYSIMSICKNCNQGFTIYPEDTKFYGRITVPEPVLCPACRRQKRLAWRNERTLYRRPCDLCKKEIVSLYPVDNEAPVYCHDCWWSDDWESADYGQEFDSSRSFFEQFAELVKKVPRLAIINSKSVNSEFCNYSYANKNCYLTVGCHYEEDCFYTDHSTRNHSCLELCRCGDCELSYSCVDCAKCYQSTYLDFCKDCLDCHFCHNCSGCEHCFLSTNQLNQKFIFKNQQLSEADYQKKLAEYFFGSRQQLRDNFQEYQKIISATIQRFAKQVQCVDCLGDDLVRCKNLKHCFDCTGCADCSYGAQMDEQYDSLDNDYMGYDRSENCLETIGCAGVFNCYFCDSCWHDHHLEYCNLAFGSRECFGCVGLKNKKHCILNKQYSEEDYNKIKEKIIVEMRRAGEYGNFFPASFSPYGYNATVNMEPDNFPLNKEGAEKFGGWWQENTPGTFGRETAKDLADNIKEVDEGIIKEVLACQRCNKNYKIIAEEFKFYQKLGLPVPAECPDCRYFERIKRRNPRELHHRQCQCSSPEHGHQGQCVVEFETTYSPEQPEAVYCADCYRKETY